MSNVIHVDFGNKKTVNEIEVDLFSAFGITPELAEYLDSLREMGVDEDDIYETIDAINDMNCYFAADEEVQEFANGWLHKFL